MRPELIIFDCDGVLIDSEMVTSRLIAKNLTALGWPLTPEDSMRKFIGMSIIDMEPIIEARIGRKLPEGWRNGIACDLVTSLGLEATLIPGARETLQRVNAMGIPWRIASNSSDEEMAVKFARTGLADLTHGLAYAASSIGKPKPAPDVFLAAAASGGIAPNKCLVLEDSALGVAGAVAAGMLCYGFAPHGDGALLKAAGAAGVLQDLSELFGVLE